ncbi:MAG: DUF429 domain-containing protein [Anaerolineales bacterium]|jgi:predicted RNase H-like nuclease
MKTTIIGIDCAAQARKTGLARGVFEDGAARVAEVVLGSTREALVDTLAAWISLTPNALLALDAPLGWPQEMGERLSAHRAGEGIRAKPNDLFRRVTDDKIYIEFGKRPLEVGANLIARTAVMALNTLEELRKRTGESLDLAWEPGLVQVTGAIEVYPAVTLLSYGISVPGYKKRDGGEARRELLDLLGECIALPQDTSLMEQNDDLLDAAICVLAGADFLRGEVYKPGDLELAKKEGWIWVRY